MTTTCVFEQGQSPQVKDDQDNIVVLLPDNGFESSQLMLLYDSIGAFH